MFTAAGVTTAIEYSTAHREFMLIGSRQRLNKGPTSFQTANQRILGKLEGAVSLDSWKCWHKLWSLRCVSTIVFACFWFMFTIDVNNK